jgi:hypothetical protein
MLTIITVKLAGDGYIVNGRIKVPLAIGNSHYQAVQAWLAAGNTALPADLPWPEPETPAKLRQAALAAARPAAVDDALIINDTITIEEW